MNINIETAESTPTRFSGRRRLFTTNREAEKVLSNTEMKTSLPKLNDRSPDSSPDRYSSPPTSPCWILETPPKITGSLLHSPSRLSRFDLYMNSQNKQESPKIDIKLSSKKKDDKTRRILSETNNMSGNCSTPENDSSILSAIVNAPAKSRKVRRSIIHDDKENTTNTIQSSDKRETSIFIEPKSFYKSLLRNEKTVPQERATLTNKFTYFGGVKRARSVSSESVKSASSVGIQKPRLTQPRRLSKRLRVGEINLGVRHGIKKPRPKKAAYGKAYSKIPKILPADRIKNFLNPTVLSETGVSCVEPQSHTVESTPKKKNSPKKIPTPPPDPTKKFFKTNRTLHFNRKATVTVENNVRVEVWNGKFHLPEKQQKHSLNNKTTQSAKKKSNIVFEAIETDDIQSVNLQKQVSESVNEILDNLESDLPKSNSNLDDVCKSDERCVPDTENRADSHVVQVTENSAFENSLHEQLEMVENTSIHPSTSSETGLGLVISHVCSLSEESNKSESTDPKLYPLFYADYSRKGSSALATSKKDYTVRKRKWQVIGDDQYQIDAGQRRFGATQCKECGIVYQLGDMEDEIEHEKHHSNADILKYSGWKNERVIAVYDTGRVIVVYPDDSKIWIRKVQSVMDIVNKEIGFVDIDYSYKYLENSKVYMYVNQKTILGILAAEPKKEAHKMITIEGVDCCSSETYPVRCGVSHIWTSPAFRNRKVASRLLDCMRLSFMFDHIMEKNEFAFSVPTICGKFLAEKYTGTPNFLVYS